MIDRKFEGEGNQRHVTARIFKCDVCDKPVKVVGSKFVAVRLKLPDRAAEHVKVWCESCQKTSGVGKCFA